MKKPASLRAAIEAAIPELKNDPSRLALWIEDGAVQMRQTASHGFGFKYPLSVLLREVATEPALIAHAINRWLRVNQPDLLAGGAGDSYGFEADILDNGLTDIVFTIQLCEAVDIRQEDDGSWTGEYEAEPDPLFPDDLPTPPATSAAPLTGHTVEDIVGL